MNVTAVRPLGDRVLIRPDEPLSKTEGGLVIPEAYRTSTFTGEIVSVGPGRVFEFKFGDVFRELSVKPGDRVMYTHRVPTTVRVGDETLASIREQEILLVIEEDDCEAE